MGDAEGVEDLSDGTLGRHVPAGCVSLLFLFVHLCHCDLHADMCQGCTVQEPLGEHVARCGWDNPLQGPHVVVSLPLHMNTV